MSGFIREKYNIPRDAKIILYIGNISENKNQRQMIEAFPMMPRQVCEKTYVLFCGDLYNDPLGLKQMIKESVYPDHLILCGSIKKEHMQDYYKEGDAVVLLSFAEGFGLSLVEGMYFGLPCMMFSDIDAFADIYNENAVVALRERKNAIVAKGLYELLTKEWNHEFIKEYSKNFSSVKMANNYIITYRSVHNKKE